MHVSRKINCAIVNFSCEALDTKQSVMSLSFDKIDYDIILIGFGVTSSIVSNVLFQRGIGNTSCTFEVSFSPSGGAFGIWGPIYVFSLLTIADQIHLRSTHSKEYDTVVPNICHGFAWLFAALWTPTFTTTVDLKGTKAPSPMALAVSAVFLCCTASLSTVAVFCSSAWRRSSDGQFRWITGVAFGLLAGWTLLAASLNIAIAYKANDGVDDVLCNLESDDDVQDSYNIFGTINRAYVTPVPFVLATIISLVAVLLPNPIIALPLLWALYFIRPSYFNYIAVMLCVIAEIFAIYRTFL